MKKLKATSKLKKKVIGKFIYYLLLFILKLIFIYNLLIKSFNASNSSLLKVIPLPIFSWFGAQSLKSNFGLAPFQLTRFNSFVQPFGFSEITPKCYTISNLKSAIYDCSFFIKFYHIFLLL